MLGKAENEYLCLIGPGTPMGNLLRRFWTPAALVEDFQGNDCDPRHVRLFGEDFVIFRDTNGELGMLDEKCTHRGASLVYGRVENCGIRCIYHGWKFAVDGTIQETPNFPSSAYRERIKAPAYQVRVAAGIIWAYVGPPDKEPPFPNYSFMTDDPERQPVVFSTIEQCNWVQAIENGIDSSHVGILHQDLSQVQEFHDNLPQAAAMDMIEDDAPQLEVTDTDFGFYYAALRATSVGDDQTQVRITAYVMPYMNCIPPASSSAVLRVPIDDVNTAIYMIKPHGSGYDNAETRRKFTGLPEPGEVTWYGRDRVLTVPPQDREAMRGGRSFSGFVGVNIQDAAVYVSQGPIYDRSKEHVVPADIAVLRMRRRLMAAAAQVEAGEEPVEVRPQDPRAINAVSAVIAKQTPWQSLVPGLLAGAVD
jgi:phthalate 4,5-dioxygenase oxygenase subunit